jgi:hypothetical protein
MLRTWPFAYLPVLQERKANGTGKFNLQFRLKRDRRVHFGVYLREGAINFGVFLMFPKICTDAAEGVERRLRELFPGAPRSYDLVQLSETIVMSDKFKAKIRNVNDVRIKLTR